MTPLMTGKISRSPFNEGDEEHTMAKLLCILGVPKQQQASGLALLSFIVPNKIKPYDMLAILGK